MKITEVEKFPKSSLKKKTVPLYKAFIINDPDDEMKININIDLLAITEERAVNTLVNELRINNVDEIKGKVISFAVFNLDTKDFITKDVVDEGDVYFQNESLSITLKDKVYTLDVVDKILDDIDIEFNEKTDQRICTNIVLRKV